MFSSTSMCVSLLASLACTGSFAKTQPTTFAIDGVSYLAPSTPVLESCFGSQPVISALGKVLDGNSALLTVLKLNETVIDKRALAVALEPFAEDDVWTDAFLQSVAIVSPANSTVSSDAYSYLAQKGVQYVISEPDEQSPAPSMPSVSSLRPGPHYVDISSNCVAINEVYRLYVDNLLAFTQGITPVPGTDAFSASTIFEPGTESIMVPVPSRLYSLEDHRPLSGLRVAVKDLFFMKGLKTGGGSRARFEMYPESEMTASAVGKLLDLGAVAVGITKTSQFAYGVEPWQWNDFSYPRNPRGDGWLEVAFSSSGSGAAIAGYEWLDFALGSDTGGSVRMPAALGGSYGIRPTHDVITLSGVLPLASAFDTAGFFARDPRLFSKVGPLWYEGGPVDSNRKFSSFPKELHVPVDYFPLKSPVAQAVLDEFIAAMEEELGMTTQHINVTDILSQSQDDYISDPAIGVDLEDTASGFDSWNDLGKDLVKRWEAAHPGDGFPLFDAPIRKVYGADKHVTEEEYEEAIAKKYEFRKYGEEYLMRPSLETCSQSIMVLESGASGLPCYREKFLNEKPGAGFLYSSDPGPWISPVSLSPLLSTPQISIPIGQVEYESPITLQTEYLPVVVDLMAAHGCDGMLYALVETLAENGVLKEVKAGRTAF